MSDKEATRKYASSGTFIDLCNRCFVEVEDDIPVIDGKGEDGEADETFEE